MPTKAGAAAARLRSDRIFSALGDPTRRAIVEKLSRGQATVSHLAEPLAITITAVRQHLDVLEACGLVRTEKVGRTRTCTFDAKGLAVLETWISQQRSHWEGALDRLGDMLEDEE